MSKEKRRVPKLRFPGFTEDWEQRKLESLFTKYEDKVNTPNSGYWRLGLRSHCKGTFHTYIDAGNELETAEMNRVKSGNFILNITFAWERALAVTNDEDQDKLVSHRFPQFKPNSDLVIDFFKHTLMDKRFKHHLELSSPGGAGRNKVLKVADMLKYELLVPSIKEQNEISSFLNHVDYIITLHQRKLDNLKLKKKALLQKLFPKNGERYPELRFPGFTDAWEQRKLGNIVDFLDGQRKPLKESERTKGKYPYYGASGIIDYINDYLFDENLVLLSEDGANIIDRNYPVCFIATGKYWVNNHAHVLKVKTGVIDKFICESLERLDYTKFNTGTAQPKLNQDICQKIVITIPNEDEQKCISEFLDKINNIITLHQRKLDHLQLQKKALLQQMFV